MRTSGHVCDIPTLLSFFFQLHHNQSSTLHRTSFFRKMFFVVVILHCSQSSLNFIYTVDQNTLLKIVLMTKIDCKKICITALLNCSSYIYVIK